MLSEEQKRSYGEAKALCESCADPESAPFKSKYAGREILHNLRDFVHNRREEDAARRDYSVKECSRLIKLVNEILHAGAVEAALEFQLGVNYVYTDEISGGEERFKRVFELIDSSRPDPDTLSINISTLNQLGLLWSNREDGICKAHGHLSKAEKLYLEYKESFDQAPLTVDDHFALSPTHECEKVSELENLHTHTLYYLAQAYKTMGESDQSASYCMKTLRRQLKLKSYRAAEWALNCACLSQYFISQDLFWEGRHCLACADTVLALEENCEDDQLKEKRADIARCWLKYCLCLLDASKQKISNEIGELDEDLQQCGIDEQRAASEYKSTFEVFELEVTSIEEQVPCHRVVTFDQARVLFARGTEYAATALKQFVLDGFVTDHIEINQDVSRLYQHIAFFQPSHEVKCRMHKRRIDLLTKLLSELNPQFYLMVCRQLDFELAETYSEMMDLKLVIATSSPDNFNRHSKKKINSLCQSGIKHFRNFLSTAKREEKSRYEEDVERPALVAHFCIARLFSKMVTDDARAKRDCLTGSLLNYKFVADYVQLHPAAETCVSREVDICRDMLDVLPPTIDRLQ